jgi:hypothetical protein
MVFCEQCGGPVDKPKVCKHCGERFCSKHVAAGSHECPEVQHFTLGNVEEASAVGGGGDTATVRETVSRQTRSSQTTVDDGPSFEEQLQNFERQERERTAEQVEQHQDTSDVSMRRSGLWYSLRRLVTGVATLFLLASAYGMVSVVGVAPAGVPSTVPVLGQYLQLSANAWPLSIPAWAAVAWFSLKL